MITDILSLKELCSYLKVTPPAIYKLVQRKKVPSFKVGRELRFRKAEIDRWIKKQEDDRRKIAKKGRRRHSLS